MLVSFVTKKMQDKKSASFWLLFFLIHILWDYSGTWSEYTKLAQFSK